MNSRERVVKTLNFQQPDRVPIDLGGMKASGITVAAYNALKKHLGMGDKTKVWDTRFMIAMVEEAIRRRFHVDVVPLDASTILAAPPEEQWVTRKLFDGDEVLFLPGTRIQEEPNGDWRLLHADGSPSSFRMPHGGFYFDDTSFGVADGEFDPRKFKPITSIPDESLRALEDYGRHLYRNTDYALLGWGYGVCFLGMSLITDRSNIVTQGMPKEWMMMLMTEKDTCHEVMGKSIEAYIQCLKPLVSGYKSGRFNWLENSVCSSWGSTSPKACKMGTFSKMVMLRICRIL